MILVHVRTLCVAWLSVLTVDYLSQAPNHHSIMAPCVKIIDPRAFIPDSLSQTGNFHPWGSLSRRCNRTPKQSCSQSQSQRNQVPLTVILFRITWLQWSMWNRDKNTEDSKFSRSKLILLYISKHPAVSMDGLRLLLHTSSSGSSGVHPL
jgi:hypothetical protein